MEGLGVMRGKAFPQGTACESHAVSTCCVWRGRGEEGMWLVSQLYAQRLCSGLDRRVPPTRESQDSGCSQGRAPSGILAKKYVSRFIIRRNN